MRVSNDLHASIVKQCFLVVFSDLVGLFLLIMRVVGFCENSEKKQYFVLGYSNFSKEKRVSSKCYDLNESQISTLCKSYNGIFEFKLNSATSEIFELIMKWGI